MKVGAIRSNALLWSGVLFFNTCGFAADSLIRNGDFANGLAGWRVWNERGAVTATASNGTLHIRSASYNGGVHQQFSTGGAGSTIHIRGFWESDPTLAQTQWAEVLLINGPRVPVDGQDVTGSDADVIVVFKNDTGTSPGGWSGAMERTSPVSLVSSVTAAFDVASIVLKSGNTGGAVTGTRFDDVVVSSDSTPLAVATATPPSGAAPLEVHFDASASSAPMSATWDFGDGETGAGATTSHVYRRPGRFTVSLTVTDRSGASDRTSLEIAVLEPIDTLLRNGDFERGLDDWSLWTERGSTNASVSAGRLQLQSESHNGGAYQTFATGGPGTVITADGFWSSSPTVTARQWAEVLVINGPRIPLDGQDVTENDPDVVLLYKNDSWTSPGGWSGTLTSTAPVASVGTFTASSNVATLVLKSGNLPGVHTGTRFDDIVVRAETTPPPPQDDNRPPVADASVIPQQGVAPLAVSFDAGGSFDPDGDALHYSWDFGGVGSATGVSASFTYENPGTFHGSLTVDDGRGGTATTPFVIDVSTGTPPSGPNLVVNPGLESGFTNGVATGWRSWTSLGSGYWKRSSRLGRIGSGSYGSGSQVLAAVKRLNPKIILLEGNALGMAEELRATFPDALMIGRLFIDHLTPQYLSDPERFGRKHAEDCVATNRPEIEVWQGLNEPFVNDVEEARRVARFEKAFSDRLQELGKKSVVLNLAVGNPGDMDNMLLPEVVGLLETADYAGYHTYGGNEDLILTGPQSPWFAHRWRFYVRMYEERGLRMPPVLYTEVNTFFQWKEGHTPSGVEPLTPEEFRDDLVAFEVESRTDPWAVGMAIFLLGSSSPQWDGREISNEPVVYEAAGDHNWSHPADARGGVFSQQFGTDAGMFVGGVVQKVAVEPGATYQLTSSTKIETRLPRSEISFRVGYDPTGQTTDGSASTIIWSSDLVEVEARETDIWYERALTLTTTGDSLSLWFSGSQRSGAPPFRISLDEVKLERLTP